MQCLFARRNLFSPHTLFNISLAAVGIGVLASLATPAQAKSENSDLEIGGQGTGNGKFRVVRDITFDAQNNLYVLDGIALRRENTKGPDGKNVQTKSVGGNGLVQKFDNNGKFLLQFSIRAMQDAGDAINQYDQVQDEPQRIAVDSKGNVYVTKPSLDRVEQYSADGTPQKSLHVPEAMAVTVWKHDGKEQIAVVGSAREVLPQKGWTWLGGDEISVFDLDGTPSTPIPLPQQYIDVQDLTADKSGHLYMLASPAQGMAGQIYKFDASGKLLTAIGSGGKVTRAEDGSELLYSVAVDSKGYIYTVTYGNGGWTVQFDPQIETATRRAGQFKWGDVWTAASGYTPLAFDNNDRLWEGVTGYPRPDDPNLKRMAPTRPGVVRANTNFFDPKSAGVKQASALLLGFKPSITSTLPYNISYDLNAVPVEFVVAPSNRRVKDVSVAWRVYDMDKNPAGQGKFDVPLKDGEEARHTLMFTPPRYGWYQVQCEISSGGKVLTAIGENFGVTKKFDGMNTLAEGESHGGWEDAPRQMFSGMSSMRLHASKGLDALDKDLEAATTAAATVFVQITDKKADFTPEKVRPIIERFKGRVKVWELFNEPNFSFSPDDFIAAARPIIALIHEVDPGAKVMGPSVVNLDLAWVQKWYEAGLGQECDILALHDYEGHAGIDPVHWRYKYSGLRKIMAQYGDENKPIWQTERGVDAVRGGNFMPATQAVRVLLHQDLLETLGTPNEHDSLYYLNEGGYASTPLYLWSSAGPHAAPIAMRARYVMTTALGRKYADALDFGASGNKFLMGLRFTGSGGSTIILRNLGASDQKIAFDVKGADTLNVMDAFGNAQNTPVQNGKATLPLSQMPIYVLLNANQTLSAPRFDFGKNLASDATFKYSVDGANGVEFLNDGIWNTVHHDNPNGGTDGKKIFTGDAPSYPQTLDINFPAPRAVSRVLLAGLPADNAFCALLDYDWQYKRGDDWVTIKEVHTPLPVSDAVETPQCTATTYYQNTNLHVDSFAPVTTDALRLVVRRTTFGLTADETARDAMQKAWGNTLPPKLNLREIEVYGP